MNRLLLVLASAVLLALASGCAVETSDQTDTRTAPTQNYTMEQFVKTKSIRGSSLPSRYGLPNVTVSKLFF